MLELSVIVAFIMGHRHSKTDYKAKLESMITGYGYPCQWYVTEPTDDGFRLTLLRIPYGAYGTGAGPRPVVFLQHGLASCAASWIMTSPSDCLGYILADAGYDVWLGNVRGSMFSMDHTIYNPKEDKFWDWTWDEMARYDTPTMLNTALQMSGQSELVYIGHSQGTLTAFTGLGLQENQDIANKVKAVIALAPIATLGHTTWSMRDIADVITKMEPILGALHLHGVLQNKKINRVVFKHKLSREIVDRIINFLTETNLDKVDMNKISKFYPAGTSIKTVLHYAEMAVSDKCQRYHGGAEYDLSAMTIPTYLFAGGNDRIADQQDVEYLRGQLGENCVLFEEIPDWDHADFVWGQTATAQLYTKIVDILGQLQWQHK